jgi:integrase
MKLRKRTNGIWMLDYTDPGGNRKRVSLGTRDKAQAQAEAKDILAGTSPTKGIGHMPTLGEALEDTYERIWSHQKGHRSMFVQVRALSRKYGDTLLADITYETLNDWVGCLRKEGLKNATINRKLSAISKAMTEAVKLGRIPNKPPIPRLVERNKKLRWITPEEEELLLKTLLDESVIIKASEQFVMRHVIIVLVDTGMRLGELLKLEPEQITTRSVRLLDTKNSKSRAIPLTKRASSSLAALSRSQAWDELQSRADRGSDRLIKLFTKVRNAAGLPDVSLHTLRHTCASRLVQAGVDLYRVKQWLGHSSITVTERYAHLSPSSLDGALLALENPQVQPSGTTGTDKAHLRLVK